MEDEYTKARLFAYSVLATRMQTGRQLEQRLRGKGYSGATVEKVLSLMEGYKYIDDKEYARLWIRKRRLKRGCPGLKRELLEKGVDVGIIEETLAELDPEEEYEAALNIAKIKLGLSKDARSLRRLWGYLQRRGFSYEVTGRVCRVLQDE